jgi:hypothetical protein
MAARAWPKPSPRQLKNLRRPSTSVDDLKTRQDSPSLTNHHTTFSLEHYPRLSIPWIGSKPLRFLSCLVNLTYPKALIPYKGVDLINMSDD